MGPGARAVKPRLRWNGLIWADPARLLDAWRYWRAWYATGHGLYNAELEARFQADETAELVPA